VVEGAQDSTRCKLRKAISAPTLIVLQRHQHVESGAPSTTVRSLRELQWSPSPAIAGAEGASDRVLAARFAPEFCGKNESHGCFASK
jgi:hypothetical protein